MEAGVNFYPFHIGDYLSATRHLSWEEDAAYRRLLDVYYTTERALPADLRACCRLVLASTDSQREAVRVVLEEFFTLTDAGWFNRRVDAELCNLRERQDKQRDRANKRWHKPQSTPGNAGDVAEPVSGNAVASQTDATASKAHATVMPPVPVPVPVPVEIQGESARKRTPPPTQPAEVSTEVWQDFQALRKTKRAPLTATALDGIRGEAAKAGIGLEQALAYCCSVGWQGFNAGWYAERHAKPQQHAETFRERDQRQARERWETMTGRTHPDSAQVIDLKPAFLEIAA